MSGRSEAVVVLGRRRAGPRRRRWVPVAAVVAALALIGAGTVVLLGDRTSVAVPFVAPPTVTVAPPAPEPAEPVLTPADTDAPVPAPGVLAPALAALAAEPGLGTFTGTVLDAATGEVLFAAGADVPQVPASTTKVLTAAAALLTLDPDATVATTVVADPTPGQVVLVGGGDPTLSGQPAEAATAYPGAARLDELVAQVRASGVEVTSVLVDVSAYTGPLLATGWLPQDVGGGFIAPIEPVMLDGARSDPLAVDPPRSATPALDAGRELARRLGVDPAATVATTADPAATELARVSSAPLDERLADMLLTSDNVLAETVGREVALARGEPASFAGATTAVRAVLAENGFDVTGLSAADTGGLSTANAVPARLLAEVVTAAAVAEPLRPLLDWLPVAGATGTLAQRYGVAATAGGAGYVRAKTGSLAQVSTLAGLVTDADGRVLTFALMSNGASPSSSRPLLDAMASLLRACGCR